jgi:hypothetical protein
MASYIRDAEAGGVGREDSPGLDERVEVREHLLLELELLGDGFDEKVRVLERFEVGGEANTVQSGERLVECELAALDTAFDAPLAVEDGVAGGVDDLVVDVADDDVVAGDGEHLGDATTHHATAQLADSAYILELHGASAEIVVRRILRGGMGGR